MIRYLTKYLLSIIIYTRKEKSRFSVADNQTLRQLQEMRGNISVALRTTLEPLSVCLSVSLSFRFSLSFYLTFSLPLSLSLHFYLSHLTVSLSLSLSLYICWIRCHHKWNHQMMSTVCIVLIPDDQDNSVCVTGRGHFHPSTTLIPYTEQDTLHEIRISQSTTRVF